MEVEDLKSGIISKYSQLVDQATTWKADMMTKIMTVYQDYPSEILSVDFIEYTDGSYLILAFKIITETENQELKDSFSSLAELGNWFCPHKSKIKGQATIDNFFLKPMKRFELPKSKISQARRKII